MIFITERKSRKTHFSLEKGPVDFLNEIKTGETTTEQVKDSQEGFNNYLKTIRRGNKTKKQWNTLASIDRLFNGRNDALKFIEDYGSMIFEAKKKQQKNQQKVHDLKY